MSKLTKNQKLAAGKIEAGKAYSLAEASALVKDLTLLKQGKHTLLLRLLL